LLLSARIVFSVRNPTHPLRKLYLSLRRKKAHCQPK
ncbi:GSCOCG00008103001-RA-CDS, partial [Cotesia congregata]